MAYAPKSNDYNSPPPYVAQDPRTGGMQYQPQGHPPPGHQEYVPLQSPPPPMCAMQPQSPVVVQSLGGFVSHYPQQIQCPVCQQQIVTLVTYEPGLLTWLIAFFICFFGGIFGCCLIPFCVPACQDAIHRCPTCHTILGQRSPF